MLAAVSEVEIGKTTGRVWGLDRKLYRHQDDTKYRLSSYQNDQNDQNQTDRISDGKKD